jgi:hypothetical protein
MTADNGSTPGFRNKTVKLIVVIGFGAIFFKSA